MNKVVLTGGIGSGKSFVASIFKTFGIPVYEADTLAKSIMQSNIDLKNEIIRKFGNQAYYLNGDLNKEFIAAVIFKNKTALDEMSTIIHKAVYDDFFLWMNNQQAPYVIMEAAIIFESGGLTHFDRSILVTAPMDLRISRLKKRGMSSEEIRERMLAQWTDDKKRELADYEIVNDEQEALLPAIVKIHEDLLLLQTKI